MIPNGREIIRDGYQRGLPVAEIARLAGSTPGSVRVIASKMGLIHQKAPAVRWKPRGIPYAGYDRHELRWGGPTVTGELRK